MTASSRGGKTILTKERTALPLLFYEWAAMSRFSSHGFRALDQEVKGGSIHLGFEVRWEVYVRCEKRYCVYRVPGFRSLPFLNVQRLIKDVITGTYDANAPVFIVYKTKVLMT